MKRGIIMICKPRTVAKLGDVNLPDNYVLTDLTVQEYDRGDFKDFAIKGKMSTPNGYPARYEGEPLDVLYDIHMDFRRVDYKLTFIDYHWELPQKVWDIVEDKLTEIAKAFEMSYDLAKTIQNKA